MKTSSVSLEIADNHVAVLEFDNAPNNYFDIDLIAAIADNCERAALEDARAIVLCSSGKVFCAGAALAGAEDAHANPLDLYRQALRIFRQPLPMVAALQGATIGGGLGLAMAADFRIASTRARLAANFAQIGLHQGFGLSVTLPRTLGQQAASDLLLTGRRVTAEEAHLIGLVDAVAEPASLREKAFDYAALIASSAPLAAQSIRKTLRSSLVADVEAAVVHECTEQRKLMATADYAEGVAAVNDRRPGQFVGR